MLSVRSASINFKTQSESRSNWKERSSAPPQRTETHSDKGTSNYGPLNAQLAPRGVDLKYWPVNGGDPDEKAHPVVNALSNACMQAARMQNAWQHALGALSRLPGTTSTIALHMPPSHGAAW